MQARLNPSFSGAEKLVKCCLFFVQRSVFVFKVKKILNVNVILAEHHGREYIAFGKGIGYHQTVGNFVQSDQIMKKFMPIDDSRKSEMIQSLNNIPAVYVDVCTQIVDYAEKKLNVQLLPSIFYALTDHLYFAVQRYHAHQSLGNRIYWEMKTYYPEMFEIGEYGLKVVEELLHVQLPKEEAANITFHIINTAPSTNGQTNVLDVTDLVNNVMTIVRTLTGGTIETDTISYSRFLTHVKFFAERYLSNKMLSDDAALLNSVYALYPEASKIALKVQSTIVNIYAREITKEELAYLIIHIHRILTK